MAAGDVVADLQSLANNAYLDIQPAEGVEWVINNIYFGGSVELYYSDGTHEICVDSYIGPGRWSWEVLHPTHTFYPRIKNVSGNSVYMGYDGVVTK